MTVVRILLVEDDDSDAAALQALVERYADEHGIEVSLTREKSAFSILELVHRFDLLLLDIDLPGINGMEIAETLRDEGSKIAIVFVTNLAQYAVHGYAVDALDFIVKPPTYGNVSMTLDRVLRILERAQGPTLVVKTRDETVVISRDCLIFAEVRGHDLVFHEADREEPIVGRGTLSALEQELKDGPFVRINASCIVNMGRLRRIRRESVIMDDGTELWFSRRRHKEASRRIAEFLGGTL